ncbi:MAG: electron transfer flavoprotein subunit alpha/FixB family protein, partial [Bacteroidales bacterium]|nr:electron transfer flavoprotein subunit alpha/FixB family protein [Bacteroidales bacterium]
MDKSQYKNVFVFCEQRGGKLQNVALELLGKAHDLAKDLDQEVYAMLLGHNVKSLSDELIAHGADKVLVVDDACLENYTTEPYTQAVYQIICDEKPSIVLIGATTLG